MAELFWDYLSPLGFREGHGGFGCIAFKDTHLFIFRACAKLILKSYNYLLFSCIRIVLFEFFVAFVLIY